MASDLIYREDAKVFVRHACYKKINPIDYLDEVPAADVRPVVLCRDCKWFGEKKDSLRGCCALLGIYPAKDWYCAFGTRMTNCGADMRGPNLDTTKGDNHD